jgi:hypothetical protein
LFGCLQLICNIVHVWTIKLWISTTCTTCDECIFLLGILNFSFKKKESNIKFLFEWMSEVTIVSFPHLFLNGKRMAQINLKAELHRVGKSEVKLLPWFYVLWIHDFQYLNDVRNQEFKFSHFNHSDDFSITSHLLFAVTFLFLLPNERMWKFLSML